MITEQERNAAYDLGSVDAETYGYAKREDTLATAAEREQYRVGLDARREHGAGMKGRPLASYRPFRVAFSRRGRIVSDGVRFGSSMEHVIAAVRRAEEEHPTFSDASLLVEPCEDPRQAPARRSTPGQREFLAAHDEAAQAWADVVGPDGFIVLDAVRFAAAQKALYATIPWAVLGIPIADFASPNRQAYGR